jgi:hypothetical protein
MKIISLIIGLLFICCSSFAQFDAADKLFSDFDKYRKQNFQEKIFVHTDKDFYLSGEVIWFKIYCVDGIENKLSSFSKVAYVEIIDFTGEPVLQAKIKLDKGKGDGSFYLPATLISGKFKLRAYTSWMKNYDPDFYFNKEVTIINSVVAQERNEEGATEEEFLFNFFPEGGNLVNGINSKLAFKATDHSGKGITVNGVILNHRNDTVKLFRSEKYGIGSFSWTPDLNSHYKAIVRSSNGKYIRKEIPIIYEEGYVLNLNNDGRILTLEVSTSMSKNRNPVYLMVHTRNKVKYLEKRTIELGKSTFAMETQTLEDGISHFTLFDNNLIPVAERLFFKKPKEQLNLSVSGSKTNYSLREAVNLNIQSGSLKLANVSAAVFHYDTIQMSMPDQENIFQYLWLSSDLKGKIENPSYYFSGNSKEINEALDNLILTHGWRRFNWDEIQDPNKAKPKIYNAEPEGQMVRGSIIKKSNNQPASGVLAYMSAPGKNFKFYMDKSLSNGEISFFARDFYGEGQIYLHTESDSLYSIEISNPFCSKKLNSGSSFFELDDIFRSHLETQSINVQINNIYSGESIRKIIPELHRNPFFYVGDHTYKLDDYVRFPTMEEVLREYVLEVMVRIRKKKFFLRVLDTPHKLFFPNNPLILIDGVPVFDSGDKIVNYDPLKVEKLEIVAQKFNINSYEAEGILSFTTYKGDLDEFPLDENTFILNYAGLQTKREFFAPQYVNSDEKGSKIPDRRSLLYWNPDINLGNQPENINFYTSDVSGKYIAVVQGIDEDGKAGYQSFTFDVIGEVIK